MAEELQKQIDELKGRILNLEFLLSLGAELIVQQGLGSPDERVYIDYSKLSEEILLSEDNEPKKKYIDHRKYPFLVSYIDQRRQASGQ